MYDKKKKRGESKCSKVSRFAGVSVSAQAVINVASETEHSSLEGQKEAR